MMLSRGERSLSINSISGILRIISNPVRESIILSLKGAPMVYSDVMRACGLDPNYDTGPFNYHVSVLLDSNLIEKKTNKYHLSVLGETIASFVLSLRRESNFLLRTEKHKEVRTRMGKIDTRWIGQQDLDKKEHGMIATSKHLQPIDESPTEERQGFYDWQGRLPQLEMPPHSFFGHVSGFEENGVGLGSIHLRFFVRRATNTATAQVTDIFTVDNNYRKIGETRQSVLRQMIKELLGQLREHGVELVEVVRVYSGDQALVNVLKELTFERAATTYMMQKKLA